MFRRQWPITFLFDEEAVIFTPGMSEVLAARPTLRQNEAAMRVLIVEDEPKMAAFLARGLREHGLMAEECHRGDEALERILGASFDAVVLDIMLPGLDGLALTRRLRAKGNTTPVSPAVRTRCGG